MYLIFPGKYNKIFNVYIGGKVVKNFSENMSTWSTIYSFIGNKDPVKIARVSKGNIVRMIIYGKLPI